MSSERGHRDRAGYVASALLGVVAAVPWLYSFSYSRGYDLFLWIYNAWHLKESLGGGTLPNWSAYGACGQPFYKIAGLSDGAVLAGLMGLWGTSAGVQFFVLLLYITAATGLYRLAFILLGCRFSAWIAAAAYVLSWFITFTVYFQAYLGNMFGYAALPWFVLFTRRAIETRALAAVWWSALILAAAVLANPQVAIKILLISAGLALPLLRLGTWRSWFAVWVCIGGIALAFSLFDITSAMRLRSEVVTINARPNSYIGPFTLVAIPAFVLGILTELATGYRWPQMHLWQLLYSEYPGMLIGVLAVAGLILQRDRAMVRCLGIGVGISYTLFFFVMPYLRASPWLGTSHNMLILPVVGLALLCGYGALGLRHKLGELWGETRANRALYVVAGLLCIESYALLLGLKIWGTSGTAPTDLPEVGVWHKVAEVMRTEANEPRFFSFNPDWTIGLFPVLTELPTANVVELRQRSPDYQAYINLLARCGRSADCGVGVSALLAPLNVAFVDLPRKYFTYVGPNSYAAGYAGYAAGIAAFDRDVHLQRFAMRAVEAEDLGRQAAATDWSPLRDDAPTAIAQEWAQVVYSNEHRLPAFVAGRTVAILGTAKSRQAVFERIIALSGYDPGRILFLLLDSLDELGPVQRQALAGYITANDDPVFAEVPRVGLQQLQAWYGMPDNEGLPQIQGWDRQGAEALKVGLDQPVRQDRFLFVSQQRFKDWQGRYANGESAPVYRGTAGLSAVFLTAGSQEVVLQYGLPDVERITRWISLSAFAFSVLAVCSVGPVRACLRKRLRKNANREI